MRATRLALAPALFLAGCMPWLAPPGARTTERGRLELGVGVTTLLAPAEPDEPVPVPQAWARLGIARRWDLGLAYAAPMSGFADVRFQLLRSDLWDATLGAGGGVHGFPDVGGLGEAIVLPVGSVHLAVARRRSPLAPYVFARVWLPAYLASDPPAAVAWLQVGGGVEWTMRGLRHGPQLGAVVPSTGLGDGIATIAWGVRWP